MRCNNHEIIANRIGIVTQMMLAENHGTKWSRWESLEKGEVELRPWTGLGEGGGGGRGSMQQACCGRWWENKLVAVEKQPVSWQVRWEWRAWQGSEDGHRQVRKAIGRPSRRRGDLTWESCCGFLSRQVPQSLSAAIGDLCQIQADGGDEADSK